MKKNIAILTLLFAAQLLTAQNVGINTETPQGKLHIQANSTVNTPQLRLTEEGDDYARIKLESDAINNVYWDIAGSADTTAANARLNFYYKSPMATGDRMTILGNGNVGINTTSPSAKLDIRNLGNGQELLKLSTERPWVFKQTGSSFQSKLTFQSTFGHKIFEIVSTDSSYVSAAFRASDTQPATYLIPDIGRVGVGTYNPNARMAIEGHEATSENILRVNVNYEGESDIVGLDCDSYPATGYGIGANFRGGYRGLRGLANPGTSSRMAIGVVGAASGENNQGTRVGLWGNAFGGNINWAGYFDGGNVYVKNELRIGSGALSGASGYKVAIDGKMIAEEVRVQLDDDWPDYVFEENYDLTSLPELEKEIQMLGHLPGVPSAAEVEEEGIMLGDMQKILTEKVEELTLYILQLDKQIQQLKKELDKGE